MKTTQMAWRNVWRNRRRSVVTIAAMAFALLLMILYSGIIQGYLASTERRVVALETADVQIHAPEYRAKPSLHRLMEDADTVVGRLEAAGLSATPRLLGSGLGAAGNQSAGIQLRGVDLARDAGTSDIHRHVREGTWLAANDPSGVVIGRKLAKTLHLKPGSELVVLSQGADGSMANDLYVVRGVLSAIGDVVDRAGVYMNAAAFRELMVVPQGAHQILVRRKSETVTLDQVAAAAKGATTGGEFDVKTWRELMPTLARMIDGMHQVMYVMFGIVYIAIGIVLLNAMLMAVFERIREFGVLKAIGVPPGGVLRLVFTESLLMIGAGLCVGVLAAIPSLIYLRDTGLNLGELSGSTLAGVAIDPVWRAAITPNTFIGPIAVMMLICLLAVVYPAFKAAFIRPVVAMRHR